MSENFGLVLDGNINILQKNYDKLMSIPYDMDLSNEAPEPIHKYQNTIKEPFEISARGTFHGKKVRKLIIEPSEKEGWWFDRTDLNDSLPVKVSIHNVWTTGGAGVSNIVLRSGSSNNYIRLVEHIIALKSGTNIDNLKIKLTSGDPPLFNKGSVKLVEALDNAGVVSTKKEQQYVTVKEKVTLLSQNGGFLIISPATKDSKSLSLDCTRDFNNAIGVQRIKFPVNSKNFNFGSMARTNASTWQMYYCKTIGKFFADTKNLGYTKDNVLVVGKNKYLNTPELLHNGKSLEAAWHRAVLDLLAATALVDTGRFVGDIVSYKGGHALDVEMIKMLFAHDLLTILQTAEK